MNNYSITARFVNVKALRDLPGQSKTHLSNPKTNKKKSWMKKKARCGDNTAITIKKNELWLSYHL